MTLHRIEPLKVYVRELGDNGISLRTSVTTSDIDQNFSTCSDIREKLLKKFKENNIEFAYPHMTIDGKIKQ